MQIKGFTRNGKTVVNTDTSEFDLIRQKRQSKRAHQHVQDEIGQLREMVIELTKRIEVLERVRST